MRLRTVGLVLAFFGFVASWLAAMKTIPNYGNVLIVAFIGAALVRAGRYWLRDLAPHPFLEAFPGAVTIGGYAAVFVSAAASLVLYVDRKGEMSALFSRHALTFFLMAAFSINTVLLNYGEILREKKAWYGLVILVDLAAWTLFSVVIQSYPYSSDLAESNVLLALPVIMIWREVAFMSCIRCVDPSNVDLLMLTMIVVGWALLPLDPTVQARRHRRTEIAKFLLIVGFVYWALTVIEAVAARLFGLGPQVERVQGLLLVKAGMNFLFLILAVFLAWIVRRWNARNLWDRFAT